LRIVATSFGWKFVIRAAPLELPRGWPGVSNSPPKCWIYMIPGMPQNEESLLNSHFIFREVSGVFRSSAKCLPQQALWPRGRSRQRLAGVLAGTGVRRGIFFPSFVTRLL
jgi:hypothetical protein